MVKKFMAYSNNENEKYFEGQTSISSNTLVGQSTY